VKTAAAQRFSLRALRRRRAAELDDFAHDPMLLPGAFTLAHPIGRV
jgi:hypothetical protein